MSYNNPIFRYIQRNGMFDDLLDYGAYMFMASGLSLFNSAVLLVQRPGLGFAASETVWNRKYGRLIKPEARPLLIVKPFGPLDIYYEVADTYSPYEEKLPEWIYKENNLLPPFPCEELDSLKRQIVSVFSRHGVYYAERDFGERKGGEVQYSPNALCVTYLGKKRRAVSVFTHYSMTINSRHQPFRQLTSIFHEIGHLLCGHLQIDEEINKNEELNCKIPKRDIERLTPHQQEYEAEMTCKLIMKSFGFEHSVDESIQGIEKGKAPLFDPDIVVSAADRFLAWYNKAFPNINMRC